MMNKSKAAKAIQIQMIHIIKYNKNKAQKKIISYNK